MPKFSRRRPGPSPHEQDRRTALCVRKCIEKLSGCGTRFTWFRSRGSDILRVEAMHDNMHFKMAHAVPEGHAKYVYMKIRCGDSGRRTEDIVLEIADLSYRWGRSMVVKERFALEDPLFKKALATFEALWEVAIQARDPSADVLSYQRCVNELNNIL